MTRRVSFQRQIMEAGFGEMLQDFGFVKHSATHYRRETDRIIWDQVTLAHTVSKPQPRAFRDLVGLTLVGFEEIYREFVKHAGDTGWKDESFLNKIPGTKLLCHADYDTITSKARREDSTTDGDALEYWDPKPPKGFFKSLLWTPPKPPDFYHRHPDAVYGHSYNYWQVREERDLRDFTDELCCYWIEAVWSEMQLDEDPETFCRGQTLKLIGPGIDVWKAIVLWMHGYHELVQHRIEDTLPRADETYESIERYYEKDGTFQKNRIFRSRKHRDDLIRLVLDQVHDSARAAQALNDTFKALQ